MNMVGVSDSIRFENPVERANAMLGVEVADTSVDIAQLPIARQLAVLACQGSCDIDSVRTHMTILNRLDAYEHDSGAELFDHQITVFDKLHDFIANPPLMEDGQIIRRGLIKMPTRTGKTAVFSKLLDAISSDDGTSKLKTLVLVNRLFQGEQTIGEEGLAKFAPDVEASKFNGKHKDLSGEVVIMTAQSFLAGVKNGTLKPEDFDIGILDEVHRFLGPKTKQAIEQFFGDKILIGLTATPNYSVDRKSSDLLPHEIATMHLREAVDSGFTAPIRCLLHTTEAVVPDLDPNRKDFSSRELERLAHVVARNKAIVDYVKSFVSDGRQGIVGGLPGYNLAHPKLIAERLRHEDIIDKSGQQRKIRAAWVGGSQTEAEQADILARYEAGEIDVLTHVNLLTESFTSNVASFYINGCPTTSPVKLEQAVGRILGKKANGLESIVVEFLDKSIGKQQQTMLGLLGVDDFELTRVIGERSAQRSNYEADTYLRGILHPELLAKLTAISGTPIKEILLGLRQAGSINPDQAELEAWEQRLVSEGMPSELGRDTMGIPKAFHRAFDLAYKQALAEGIQNPGHTDVYERIERDRKKLGLKTGDDRVGDMVEGSMGLQITNGTLTTDFEDGLGFDVSDHDATDPADKVIDYGKEIERVTRGLDDREQLVLKLRYGFSAGNTLENLRDNIQLRLDQNPDKRTVRFLEKQLDAVNKAINNDEPLLLGETGEILNLSRERIRQIEARAMSKLRNPYMDVGLRDLITEPAYGEKTIMPLIASDLEMQRGVELLKRAAEDDGSLLHDYINRISEIVRLVPQYKVRGIGIVDRAIERVGLGRTIDTRISAVKKLLQSDYTFSPTGDAWLYDLRARTITELETKDMMYGLSQREKNDIAARNFKREVTRRLYAIREKVQ